MRAWIRTLAAITLIAASCVSTRQNEDDNPYLGATKERPFKVLYVGGDGTGCESAIVIQGATNTFQGIAAENQWLREHYPGAQRVSTQSGDCADRITDIVGIRMPDGTSKTIIFDITEFYGKW